MTALATVYATDENIAVRAGNNFAILCPVSQKIAYATDGIFSSGNRWLLTSASTDWVGQGVTAGMVVQLSLTGTYSPPSELLAVDSVSVSGAILRRLGREAGEGLPPGGASGTAGIKLTITSLSPQIEEASYDLNRRFGCDPLIAGRRPADFYDSREVPQACCLTVLRNQYLAQARMTGDSSDDFAAKAKKYDNELTEVLARLVVHWNAVGQSGAIEPTVTRFGTRMSR